MMEEDCLSLVENGYISPEEYLADVEIGNEIVSGSGQTVGNNYTLNICVY